MLNTINEKQIEEIQHTVENYYEGRLIIGSNDLARKLYKIAVPKDSVMLSVNDWINFNKDHANELIKTREEEYGLGYNQGSKETAEKLIAKIKQFLSSVETIVGDTHKLQPEIGYSMREVDDLLDELEKQFSVDIKE